MPAIFSFSLDYRRDRDIIERLERHKNRSSFIRRMLRTEFDNDVNVELIKLLYREYCNQVEMRYTMPLDTLRKPKTMHQFREQAILKMYPGQNEEE